MEPFEVIRKISENPTLGTLIGGTGAVYISTYAIKGTDWLLEKFSKHSKKVIEIAEKNAESYLIKHLIKRVKNLEDKMSEYENIISNSWNQPDLSLLMQKSLIAAAITENEDKHAILAELITKRLIANTDDLVALAGAKACEVVPHLSSKQIRLLSIMTCLFNLRKVIIGRIKSQTQFNNLITDWIKINLSPLIQKSEKDIITYMDFKHLLSTSCLIPHTGIININKVFSQAFERTIVKQEGSQKEESEKLITNYKIIDLDIFTKDFLWWKKFLEIWNLGIKNHRITTVGELIGILYIENALNTKIELDEWF